MILKSYDTEIKKLMLETLVLSVPVTFCSRNAC